MPPTNWKQSLLPVTFGPIQSNIFRHSRSDFGPFLPPRGYGCLYYSSKSTPPPLALPWPIRWYSHQLGNPILIDFAFLGSRTRHPVQKLWTIENGWDMRLKLYLAVFLVFPECISVFPTTCEDPAQSVDWKCNIGKWIWTSESEVMVDGTFSTPLYQTVFVVYLGCISRISGPYLCMSDLTGW